MALVISRKIEETVHIGENIRVTVVQVNGRSVSLLIEAPMDMVILRDEHIGTPVAEKLAAKAKHRTQGEISEPKTPRKHPAESDQD